LEESFPVETEIQVVPMWQIFQFIFCIGIGLTPYESDNVVWPR